MAADPWELLREAREALNGSHGWDCDCGVDDALQRGQLKTRIDAALAEHEKPTWHPSATNPNVIETMAQETWERRLWVERMVLNDPKGKIGYWAHIGHSIVNCFDTEEEAKEACLRWYRERK